MTRFGAPVVEIASISATALSWYRMPTSQSAETVDQTTRMPLGTAGAMGFAGPPSSGTRYGCSLVESPTMASEQFVGEQCGTGRSWQLRGKIPNDTLCPIKADFSNGVVGPGSRWRLRVGVRQERLAIWPPETGPVHQVGCGEGHQGPRGLRRKRVAHGAPGRHRYSTPLCVPSGDQNDPPLPLAGPPVRGMRCRPDPSAFISTRSHLSPVPVAKARCFASGDQDG